MAQLLRVDEWQGSSGKWYIADIKTWTNWRAIAEIFGVDLEGLKNLLVDKYKANIKKYIEYENKDSLLLFSFEKYKSAHQLKLDINRIARKKQFFVERSL